MRIQIEIALSREDFIYIFSRSFIQTTICEGLIYLTIKSLLYLYMIYTRKIVKKIPRYDMNNDHFNSRFKREIRNILPLISGFKNLFIY